MDRVNGNQIEKTTHIDELTGLLNLTGILNQLRLKDDYVISGDTVIIYLNVMNFKTFNQRYGFSGGNEFLKGLADEIKGIFSDEFSARTGGDQFIILAKSNDKNQILDKLAQLREAAHKYEKGMQMRIKGEYIRQTGRRLTPLFWWTEPKSPVMTLSGFMIRIPTYMTRTLVRKMSFVSML